MLAGSFAAISATDGSYTLSDLSVTGYDAPVYDEDEGELVSGGVTHGAFSLQFLSSSGTTESSYFWVDDGELEKGWYDRNKVPASSVAIPGGQAMWIVGRGLSLVSAGAVNEEDIAFPTRLSGATAVGNGTPVDLTLGKLIVSGYDEPEYDEDEGELISGGVTHGAFSLQYLTSSGATESSYFWVDDGELTKGWYDRTKKAANDVALDAGQGVWIVGRGLTLQIPAPEL